MTIRNTILAGFALLALSLGGCALGVQQVNLEYPPKPASDAAMESAGAATTAPAMPASATAPVIALVRFRDVRADKNVLGHVRNNFGMRTDDVVSPTDVSRWVTDALKWELEQAGYRVMLFNSKRAARTAGADAAVSGAVIQVAADDYFINEGEVILRTEIAKNGREILDRVYTGTSGGRFKYGATGADFAETLSQALRNGLQDVVADVTGEVGK